MVSTDQLQIIELIDEKFGNGEWKAAKIASTTIMRRQNLSLIK